MPLTLHQNLIDRTKKVHATSPWLWLWYLEVDVTTSATTVLRVVRYPQEITYDGKTFYPFPVTWNEYTEEGEANLPRLQLTLKNASRLVARQLHTGQGFIGNSVVLTVIPHDIHTDTPGEGDPPFWLTRTFHVVEAAITRDDVVLSLELPNFYERKYPEARYNPNRCRFRFGLTGQGCPYVLSSAAAYTTCGKTLDECKDRGTDMTARGFPSGLLPDRFGGFPGTDIRS